MRGESALPPSRAAIVIETQSFDGDVAPLREKLQRAMWEKAGLLRAAADLACGQEAIHRLVRETPHQFSRALLELRNLQTVGGLIVRSAIAREESRGAHYRNDFPRRDDVRFGKHSVIRRSGISFEEFQAAATGAAV
jgi:L-aspartate oxidase